MPRALWSGVLTFGLVNVPVGLFSATSEKSIRFNQLNKTTGNRVRYRKVDDATGEEVPASDIVSGYDTGDDEYVMVEREELASVAPGRSELMEISDFVDLADIDPIFYRQTYYLAPRGKGADRAYALLRRAMLDTGKAGVATMVMRDREHLVVLRPSGDALVVESLYFADEIRDAQDVLGDLPDDSAFAERELKIAEQLIESLSVDWKPENYTDTYRERVQELIESKREGRKVVTAKKAPRTNVIDLMAALEESIAARGGRGAKADKATKGKKADEEAASGETATATQSASAEYAEMSKAELLKLAAKADVAGRSSMSKDELVAALSAAPKPRRSKAS
ncbi:MAG TPA: Ku protein [Mycobacteriales bacterium]|nr:Ku protein [Mycobacteriales bacterium]